MLQIKLNDLSFSYGKNFPKIINKLNFSFNSGNIYHISGNNGSGKSTLLKLISGIIESESVSCHGFNGFLAPTCSYFNQKLGLYEELTVAENINFYKNLLTENHNEFIEQLLDKFKLKKLLNNKIFELSSGQKVKTSLLLKLFFKPKILVLDEPGNSLDKSARVTLSKIILSLKEQHSDEFIFIFVDHLEMFPGVDTHKLEL